MEVKNIFSITEDYQRAQQQWNGAALNGLIQTYFDHTNSGAELANPYGAVAANEYVEFIASSLFPCDGSWLGLDNKGKNADQQQAGQKMLEVLSNKLAETNFYNEITKLVKEGTLYNRGLILTSYKHNSLSFDCVRNKEIVTTLDSDENFRRIYTTKMRTLSETLAEFSNEGDTKLNGLARKVGVDGKISDEWLDIVTAIVPNIPEFFKKPKKKYRFAKIYFLASDGGLEQIFKKDTETEFLFTSPLMTYLPHLNDSLAKLALPYCISINSYEELTIDLNRKILNPPIAVSYNSLTNNVLNLSENGLTALQGQDKVPSPIESSQRPTLGREDIIQLQVLVDKIFKIQLIQRVKVTNVSQFEAAANELAALKAIQPAASDLVTRVTLNLLKRVHSLLKQEEKEYRQLAQEADVEPQMLGLAGKMRRLDLATSVGRFMQGATPIIQADPSALQKVQTDEALSELARAWNLSSLIKTEEEVQIERQQMKQQIEQQRQGQQQNMQADTQLKQSQAEAALKGG